MTFSSIYELVLFTLPDKIIYGIVMELHASSWFRHNNSAVLTIRGLNDTWMSWSHSEDDIQV